MVNKELFDRYQAALGTNAELFSRAVKTLVADLDGLDDAQVRERLLLEFPALVRAYGTVAAEAAREFYEQQRAVSGVSSAYGPYDAQTVLSEQLDAESARQANAVQAGSTAYAIFDLLEGRGIRDVMGCADSTLDYNASRDPAHPKWALVPHPGACAWCVMIGSQGFHYQSERTVGAARHNRCKCTPVVDFDTKNPLLAGYDTDELLRQYEEAEKSGKTHFRGRRPQKQSRTRKREQRTVGAAASHAQARKLIENLSKAESAEDFKRRAIKADEQWRASKHEGNAYRELRSSYIEMARKWGVDPNKRPEAQEET